MAPLCSQPPEQPPQPHHFPTPMQPTSSTWHKGQQKTNTQDSTNRWSYLLQASYILRETMPFAEQQGSANLGENTAILVEANPTQPPSDAPTAQTTGSRFGGLLWVEEE